MKKLVLSALCLVLGAGVAQAESDPFAVRNVTSRQRYPWNGLVDIACDLTGVGLVKLNATVLTNGAELCEAQTFIGETTFDLDAAGGATNGVRLLWNVAADLPAGFRTQDVQVKVTAEKYTPPAGQLWANGPIWADANFGTSEIKGHPEYGALYKFDEATNAVTQLKDGSRLPTKEEFEKLIDASVCDQQWDATRKGYLFTGKGAYAANSIFLSTAGFDYGSGTRTSAERTGIYWSSTPYPGYEEEAYTLDFSYGETDTRNYDRSYGMSVRVVKDAVEGAARDTVKVAALSSVAGAQTVTVSEAYFYPAKADIAPKDANRSHYRAYIIESAGEGDEVLAHAKEKGMSGIDGEKKAMLVDEKLGWQYAIEEYGVTPYDTGAFSPASFDLSGNAYLVVFYHTDGVASEVCVLGADPEMLEEDKLYFNADGFLSEGYNSDWQAMPPPPPPDEPLSNVFALDLVVGDRVAQVEETLAVDPAWGHAKTATVAIDGESSPRTYTSASNDTWETAALEPGRYAMTLEAGEDNETAAFWKTGEGWVVLDSLSITADVTFEAGKTYLFFGTNTVSGKTLTVEDGAKFAYDESAPAGFLGGTVAELPKRYMKVVEGDLYRIVEKLKGSEDNPWIVGAGVEAWTNGTDKLVVTGAGEVALMPWTEFADGITKLVKDEGVTGLEGVVATLPNLTTVNGLTLGDFSVAALGVVKAAGFSAVEVKNGEAKLGVVVSRSDELGESADWKPVSTNEVTVPAPGEQGFFIVAPQGK